MNLLVAFSFCQLGLQDEIDQDDEELNESDQKSCQQGAPEYKRLITIHAGKPKGHIMDHLNVVGDAKRLSLSEQTLEKAAESYGVHLVRLLLILQGNINCKHF